MKRIAWRAYFLAFTCVFIFGTGLTVWGWTSSWSWHQDLALSILAFIEVVALYSYVFSRQMGKPWIWAAVLFSSISATLITSGPLLMDEDLHGYMGAFLYGLLFALALFMTPLWFALAELSRARVGLPHLAAQN